MSYNNGPKIVTNGLVMYLDAANGRSIISGSTIWRDLTENRYTGSLINGPTFNTSSLGSIVFDGTNDHVSTNYTQPAYTTSSNFTWNLWVWPNGGNTLAPLIGNRGSGASTWIKLTILRMEYSPLIFGPQFALTNNVWSNACVVKNGINFSYYLNGQLAASATSTATHNANPFYVGGDSTANEYSNSRIAQVFVYDRALSASEIRQNYHASKGRFGL